MKIRFISPLRYPGGKGKLYNAIKKIIIANDFNHHIYVEPYAGGSAIGLKLLHEDIVPRIIINDFDKSIYAFWYAVKYHTEEMIELIKKTPVTIEEWHKQKEIQNNKNFINDLLVLGFSTLFLNRTNRSGIINGGPIGGKSQLGKYLIDCRFNKENIINRILTINSMKDRIGVTNFDAVKLISLLNTKEENYFINMDPPYYIKGEQLYMNHYTHEDHQLLRDVVSESTHPWIITYDNVKEINAIYTGYNKKNFDLTYTAGRIKKGKEVLIYKENIIIDDDFTLNK